MFKTKAEAEAVARTLLGLLSDERLAVRDYAEVEPGRWVQDEDEEDEAAARWEVRVDEYTGERAGFTVTFDNGRDDPDAVRYEVCDVPSLLAAVTAAVEAAC